LKQVLLIVLVVVLTVGAMAAGAGIYRWVTSDVTQTVTQEDIPIPAPTPKPQPNIFIMRGLLEEYAKDDSNPGTACLKNKSWQSLIKIVGVEISVFYDERYPGKWTVISSGLDCKGIETWTIDWVNSRIEYIGSNKSP